MQNNFNGNVRSWTTPIMTDFNFGWGQVENSAFIALTVPFGIVSSMTVAVSTQAIRHLFVCVHVGLLQGRAFSQEV